MVIDLVSFSLGLAIGMGIFLCGLIAGRIGANGIGSIVPGPIKRIVAEKEEIIDDDYFDRARLRPEDGGLPFPTDDELEWLNRHSQ